MTHRVALEGNLSIDVRKFPKELLDQMIARPGYVPLLQIEIPQALLQEGVAICTDGFEPMRIEFDLIAADVIVKETP